jgi:type 1 glutamine amidotransferase
MAPSVSSPQKTGHDFSKRSAALAASAFFLTLFLSVILVIASGKREPFNVVLVSGSNEYFSAISLGKLKEYLEGKHEGTRCTILQAGGELNGKGEYSDLAGLEVLNDCDVALFFTRRLTIDGEQLEQVKKYVNSGRPLIALRTTSHGFQNWLEFDKLVLGGNYQGHYPGNPERSVVDVNGNRSPEGQPEGPTLEVRISKDAKNHPILDGVVDFESKYSLYKTSPVAPDVEVLMTGTIAGEKPEPLAWTRIYKGARICYIGLGGLQDFENPTFLRLVANALFWTGERHQARSQALPAWADWIPLRKYC